MSKTYYHGGRRDALEDHVHALPNGELTGGMLDKPTKDQFGMHSHLYEHEEDTLETAVMHDFGDHTHVTKVGETSGPMPVPKKPGEPWQKMDSLQRRGPDWCVVTPQGNVIARGATKSDAFEAMEEGRDGDLYDKAMLDAGIDEGKWKEAKKASMKSVGAIKWPLVNYIYQNMMGK